MYGLKHHIVEISGDVTAAGQSNKQTTREGRATQLLIWEKLSLAIPFQLGRWGVCRILINAHCNADEKNTLSFSSTASKDISVSTLLARYKRQTCLVMFHQLTVPLNKASLPLCSRLNGSQKTFHRNIS